MTLLVILVGDIDSLCCSYGQKRAVISIFELSDCKKVVKKAYFCIKLGVCFKDMVSNFQDPVLINVSVCFSSWIVWWFIWNPQQLPAAHRQPVPGGNLSFIL